MQEIVDGLCKTDRIAFNAQRPVGKLHRECLAPFVRRQCSRGERGGQKRDHVDAFQGHVKGIAVEPGSIHQIFGEPGYLRDLSVDHVKRLEHFRSICRRPADQLCGELQGSERSTKLMRHHGQNLILEVRHAGMVAERTGRFEEDNGRLPQRACDDFIGHLFVARVVSADRPSERR